MEPEIRYTTTSDGVSIAYYVMGDGPSIVRASATFGSHVLLERSMPGNRPGMEALERRHRVVRYDGRGSGLSQRESSDFSLGSRLLDLESVVDHLGLERFALEGPYHSGLAAVVYAVQHPERITHLILSDAFARGRDRYEASPATRARAAMRPTTKDEWEYYALSAASADFQFSDSDRAKERATLIQASMEPAAMLAFHDATLEIDVTDLLSQIRVPTLVICRPSRQYAQPKSSQLLASRIPDSRLAVLETWTGTGINEEWLRVIGEFLGDVAPPDEASEAPRAAETAAAPTASAPATASGVAVVLFTDIVDSTALTERLGDTVFRTASRALDEAMRAAMREAGGAPVDGKVLGDGVMGVFMSASQAIAAARRCIELSAESELRLHVGLHAGDVIHEKGNVYGGAVNIASRICGLSAPGEVLVSDIVRGLARTSAGVEFEDRGEQALKGIDDAVRVYEVRWRD
jgi:class 3 adenylate cyclase/pimeloyl-ACP methyl ester carboxylesterase